MTLQDDMRLIEGALEHLPGYRVNSYVAFKEEGLAALVRVRERLAKLEAVAEAARNCRGTNHEQALRRAELRRAVAALDENETTPEICVCRPDETYCGAWDCRHKPLAAGSGK